MNDKESEFLLEKNNKNSDKFLNNKWDKSLDDYNNYLKEYIKHYKKSLRGDLSSLMKYPCMKAESEAICERLYEAHNKALLTKKQIRRIAKIQTQLANPLT